MIYAQNARSPVEACFNKLCQNIIGHSKSLKKIQIRKLMQCSIEETVINWFECLKAPLNNKDF